LDAISLKKLKNQFLCSEHFEKNQYSNPLNPKSQLNANAIPKNIVKVNCIILDCNAPKIKLILLLCSSWTCWYLYTGSQYFKFTQILGLECLQYRHWSRYLSYIIVWKNYISRISRYKVRFLAPSDKTPIKIILRLDPHKN
jgi:hypothetical protein